MHNIFYMCVNAIILLHRPLYFVDDTDDVCSQTTASRASYNEKPLFRFLVSDLPGLPWIPRPCLNCLHTQFQQSVLSLSLSLSLSLYLSIYLFVCLSVCLSVHLSICPSIYLSFYTYVPFRSSFLLSFVLYSIFMRKLSLIFLKLHLSLCARSWIARGSWRHGWANGTIHAGSAQAPP